MKTIMITLMLVYCSGTAHAQQRGPTMKSVTEKILHFVGEDGRWYPGSGWWTKGMPSGKELKIILKTKTGKKMAWATFSYASPGRDGFSKVTGVTKMWPVDYRKYNKLKKLPVGKYKMEVLYGKKTVWMTDFAIKNDKFAGKNHFYAVGRWTSLAYFSFSRGSVGSRICTWIAPPADSSWFPSRRNYRGFDFTGDIRRNGKVVVQDSGSANRPLQIDRGRVAYVCKGISFWREIKTKVASQDGEYVVSAYAHAVVNGKRTTWTVMRLKVTISGGKIVMNDNLTGKKAPAKNRILTTDAYYSTNLGSLSGIPAADAMGR
ncbi:hypothetical protein KKF84_16090 [Myxococcota bacterium]|nr:hypothetical protein [Myxococcota bacterium]MBU1536847.1 hypothetical protein [Myxococcota bacterium]